MSRAFRHAKNELRAADEAVQRMLGAADFDSYDLAWRNFLTSLEKVWVKLERACKSVPGFAAWQSAFKTRRSQDPLLRYVYQARHADQHSIAEIVRFTPGHVVLNFVGPGPHYVERLDIRGNQILNYRGSHPLRRTATPPRIELLPVTNRGVSFAVPTEHLGAPLPDTTPPRIAQAALRFYADCMAQAEAQFASAIR